jgi:putative membrane protein
MGIADLIPGISGGTIAFMCGIYEEWLASLQTLRIQSIKKIAWPFLLPLGMGIATSILLFSKLFYFLMLHFKPPLYGFFFGLIAASTYTCAKETVFKKRESHDSLQSFRRAISFFVLIGGAALSFTLTLLPTHLFFGTSFLGILFAGMLATGAMLLPGISGSFLLQVMGIYPLLLYALASPTEAGSLKLLMAMGIGISLGFIAFSRAIRFLLLNFRSLTLSVLVGFMAGGLKSLWPFTEGSFLLPGCLALIGFLLIIYLNARTKHLKAEF